MLFNGVYEGISGLKRVIFIAIVKSDPNYFTAKFFEKVWDNPGID